MKKSNKFFLISLFILTSMLFSGFFGSIKQNTFADSSIVSIDPVAVVCVYDENISFFTIRATVAGSTYEGDDVEWLLNGNVITDSFKITNPTQDSSVLKMYRIEYSHVTASDIWYFTARIKSQHSINALVPVMFKLEESPLTISPISLPTQTYRSFNMNPFSFTVDGLIEETSIQWFMLSNSNKYIKALGETSTQRTYTFVPIRAGDFVFVVKVGDVISYPFTVRVDFLPIEEIDFEVSQTTQNSNGFNTYLFTIKNIDSSYDLANINWYIVGYTSPVQYGGANYVFQPTAYGTYRIRAQYGTGTSARIDEQTIEIKINRTLEIVIATASFVGVLGLGLLFVILKNIKREKIW